MLLNADKLTLGFGTAEPLVQDADLALGEGQRLLICGATGSGKSTLAMALAGIIPQILPIPQYSGRVSLAGEEVTTLPHAALFSRLGYVAQSAEDQLWDLSVEDIIAFPLENRALPRAQIRERVRALMTQLQLTALAGRRVLTLSGGERRMVVLAAALASQPTLVVLDEPTTGLDPAARARLCDALVEAAAHVSGMIVTEQDASALAPVCSDLALLSGGKLAAPRALGPALDDAALWTGAGLLPPRRTTPARTPPATGPELLAVAGLRTKLTRADGAPVLEKAELSLKAGEVLAVIGRNGAGKTTLMKSILGLAPAAAGRIVLGGTDATGWTIARRARHIAYVPQSMRQILFHMSVAEEIDFARSMGAGDEDTATVLARYGLAGHEETNPFALSARQQGQLGLACADASGAAIAIVDEPLLARDLHGRALLETFLSRMTGSGRAVMLISHDLDLVDDVATRLAIVADGHIPQDGPVPEGWHSPAFAALGWPLPRAHQRTAA
ncbi:ATP-binding cassette domain-containing protein [Salipiger sp. 1_MG-2023]|uniref:ABC transporter ATP-binding protein n=1 Tax=Salipiger sp. 1_MG-2023 TaxID=3062665 RepID=UPI0026E462DF|nr:ABC transporter ATP-binding protein [Salipiger sp. 1_MG-2023]MDO6587778.1 ATP-binding cassette domain-containing protein [Salipiger sp. 1_MG-2023]